MMRIKTIMPALFAAVTMTLGGSLSQAADFSGKTIDWIIPFKEGGGSDKWARFYAPLLAEQLPGKPTVVVKNIPGAGSTKGANQFASRAKPNGLTILGTSGSTQFPYMLGDNRVKYEYKDWHVVLGTPTGGVVYVSPAAGITKAADLKNAKIPLLYGSQGASSLDLVPLLAFDLLGLNVDAIFGMKGRKAGRLAFERGETTIDYQTSSSYLKNVAPSAQEGKVIPLMSWGALDADGNIVRDATFPDLPSFPEVYEQVHGKKPSGPAWDAWKAMFIAGFPAQKMVFLPKGTSQDIVDTYSNAFANAIAAPDFAEASKKRLGSYEQKTGLAAQGTLKTALGVDPVAIRWVQDWLSDRYSVKFKKKK